MKRVVLTTSCLFLAAGVGGGCSNSGEANSQSSISKATAAFNSADKALASSISSSAASSLAFVGSQGGARVGAMYSPESDTYCAPSGSPLAVGSESGADHTDNGITSKYLTESGQEVLYGRRFWWCMMNHPSAGPDTVRGSIMKLKGFMCEVDRATGSGFVFDGQSHTVTISISSTCFPEQFIQMAANNGITSTSMTYTASTTPSAVFSGASDSAWSHAIDIDFPAINMAYKILMNMPEDGSQVAAMVKQTQSGSSDAYGFSMNYSGANATIRYEGRFDGYSDSSSGSWKRHIRTIATGVYSGNGGFSSITSSQGVYANVYRNSNSTSYDFRMVNAASAGIKTDTWTGSAANYAALNTATASHSTDNACYSGCSITSLASVGASALTFLQLGTAATSSNVFPNISPLSFSTIDLTADLP